MRAPRRRSGALASASTASRAAPTRATRPGPPRGLRVPPRARGALEELGFQARWLANLAGRVVTPLRATLAVAALAAVALAVSQFLDYREVAVGTADYEAYSDVKQVAPPPAVDREPTGAAHAYAVLPLALGALVALALVARGRWQLTRLAAGLGALALTIALLVDRPAGLDEGTATRDFEGAKASLEYGFYIELAAAAVLVAASLIAARYARLALASRGRPAQPRAATGPRLREASG